MDWPNAGLLVVSNINAILKNEEETFTVLFKEIVSQFIGALFQDNNLSSWATVCQIQFNELLTLLQIPIQKHAGCKTCKTEEPLPSCSTSSSGPNLPSGTPASARSDISHIKRFSPLVHEKSKIRCTVVGCSSRFAHRRSYQKHMKIFQIRYWSSL